MRRAERRWFEAGGCGSEAVKKPVKRVTHLGLWIEHCMTVWICKVLGAQSFCVGEHNSVTDK